MINSQLPRTLSVAMCIAVAIWHSLVAVRVLAEPKPIEAPRPESPACVKSWPDSVGAPPDSHLVVHIQNDCSLAVNCLVEANTSPPQWKRAQVPARTKREVVFLAQPPATEPKAQVSCLLVQPKPKRGDESSKKGA